MAESVNLQEIIAQSGDVCAREPIHIPAAIQPHGFLVGLDARTLEVLVKSGNLDGVLPPTPFSAVPSWLPPSVAAVCRSLPDGGLGERALFAEIPRIGMTEVHCFTTAGVVFCEFERMDGAPVGPQPTKSAFQIGAAVTAMMRAATVSEVSSIAAEIVRSVSGFERVLVYRFDGEGNGDVIGESKVAEWPQSFLNLRFPASDIPAQARALYRLTCDRWIPLRDYDPVPLVNGPAFSDRTFDLSLSRYRSVSPVHRMYQKNIDVDGAMSVSIMHDERLWGLIIGHHRRPHRVPAERQKQVVAIAQTLAMRLGGLLNRDSMAELERDTLAYSAMLRKLAAAEDFLAALTEGEPNIVDLLPGCSGGAVVWSDDDGSPMVRALGEAPPADEIIALSAWIRMKTDEMLFSTDCLSAQLPAFSAFQDTASGVLAAFFDDRRQPALLLFRPEVVRSVSWAGKPEKLVSGDGVPNLPRRSFDRWTEIKHGHSQPWQPWELDIANTIATTVNDVIVRQSRRIRDLNIEVERFVQALLLSGTTLYHQDRDLRYLWVQNPQIGFAPKTVGLTDWQIYDPELASRIVPVKQQVLATGRGIRVAIPSRLNDPAAEWFDLSVEALTRDDGSIKGISCAAVRITERKRAEDAMRRSEAQLREAQQIARLGHYSYDIPADRWDSSPMLDDILGIDADFVRDAAHGLGLVVPEMRDEVRALLEGVVSGRRDRAEIVVKIRRDRDHAERWASSICHADKQANGRPLHLIGVVHDIHERIEAEQSLRQAHDRLDRQTKELGRSNAELEQFAYVASHDLRQPLRMVTSYLGLVERALGSAADPDLRTFMHYAVNGAKKMDQLILGLLEYCRTGRDATPPEVLGLSDIVRESLQFLEMAVAEAGAEIVVADGLPPVRGNRMELIRLFQNLLGNAIKYRAAGRAPRIEIGWRDGGGTWELWVRDNGIGIAEKDFDRAFGIFQRLVTADAYEGTGIGLSVCKKVVEHHGGQIWIDSEVGAGTCIRFTLPKLDGTRHD